eukprot:g1968.t1
MLTRQVLRLQSRPRRGLAGLGAAVHDLLTAQRERLGFESAKDFLNAKHETFTIGDGESIGAAAAKMIDQKTSSLMVLDPMKNVVGIVTERDYLKAACGRARGDAAMKPGASMNEAAVTAIMTAAEA